MAFRFVKTDENGTLSGKVLTWLDARYQTAAAVAWSAITGKPTTFPPTIGSTSTTAVAGNDSRLTNARTPTSHRHPWSDLDSVPTTFTPATHSHGIADLPAGSIFVVAKSGATWPARPTTRTDIRIAWLGADPSPAINTTLTGTTGMYNNVDLRWVTP